MSAETDNTFEQCKQETIDNFDFNRVIAAIRATGFGWGRNNDDKSDDWFLQRCINFAIDVMDSAYNSALENNEEWSCQCGGFNAMARPTGAVILQFVLASCWSSAWGEEEDSAAERASLAGVPMVTGPRRIQKLHKET